MKKLIYQIEGYTSVYDPETKAVAQVPTLAKVIKKNPSEEEIAKAAEIAYNGQYAVEDDGQSEPNSTGTGLASRVSALETALLNL